MTVTPPPAPAWPDQAQVFAQIGRPAGFWIRFVAYLIDALILGFAAGVIASVIIVIGLVLGVSASNDDENIGAIIVGAALGVLAYIAVGWLYEALMTSSARGATLGKMAVGVRIVRADGTQLTFGRATARFFLKVLITPMVPLAIGYLLAAFTTGKRALHDFMADTLVIKSN